MNKIKELREKKGLTQKELGLILGMSQQGLSHLESGRRKLDDEQIIKICIALDTTPDELLNFEEAYKKYTDYLMTLKEEDIEQ